MCKYDEDMVSLERELDELEEEEARFRIDTYAFLYRALTLAGLRDRYGKVAVDRALKARELVA